MNRKVLGIMMQISVLAAGVSAAQGAWAMRCLSGAKASSSFTIDSASNNSHTTNVGAITVTSFNDGPNNLLWESATFNSTFTCYDDAVTNKTEEAYLYLDDTVKSLATDFEKSNLILGIRFNGAEYPITKTSDKIATGKQAMIYQSNTTRSNDNCRLMNKYSSSSRSRCADPQTITLNYSLYIKSRGTGTNFTGASKTYQVFQLDGIGGRNANGNFQEKASGISINYVECVPVLSAQTVNLGKYYAFQDVNQILRKTPFTINVTTNGKDCAKYPFAGAFSSSLKVDDQTITASESDMNNVIGIRLYEAGKTVPLNLNENIDFGSSNGTQLTKNFEAGVLLLKKPSKAGKFSSVINYEVYFK